MKKQLRSQNTTMYVFFIHTGVLV